MDALFDAPAPPPPLPRIAPGRTSGQVAWGRYRGPWMPCDDCKHAQHQGLLTEPARTAQWKRVAAYLRDRLLCHEHARHWRQADGLNIPTSMEGVGG